MKKGRVIWFTGLSGAGKTTIVETLKPKLEKRGEQVIILDGDIIRNIFPQTGFAREDRNDHVRRVGYAATLMANNGITVLCSLISPFDESRQDVKNMAGKLFTLVYVDCPIETCIAEDPKGLYKKAINKEIKNFTGIGQSYERPENADIIVDTFLLNIEESVEKIFKELMEV